MLDFQTLFAAFPVPSESRTMFLNAGVTAMASLLFQARRDALMRRSMPGWLLESLYFGVAGTVAGIVWTAGV